MGRGASAWHWRGSKKGAWRVGGRRGRETRRRARVRTRRSMTDAGKTELTRQAHGAERKRDARGQWLGTGELGPRDRERERTSEGNWRRQVGPTGQRAREGGRARGRTAADRWGPPVRRRGRAAWLGFVGRLGCFLLFFFSGFSNSFSISFFYRVFKSKFKLGFKFK
jgi:hypothetical protein